MDRFAEVDNSRIRGYVWIVLGHLALMYLLFTWEWKLLLLALGINYIIR